MKCKLSTNEVQSTKYQEQVKNIRGIFHYSLFTIHYSLFTHSFLKALSLLQPWASLVVTGAKKIETRSWSTKHRGEVLIHASTGKAGGLFADEMIFKKYIPDFNSLPFGAFIGKVTIENVIRFTPSDSYDELLPELTLEEKAFGDYRDGRYGWILTDPVQFKKPIPARGMPWIWEVNYLDNNL